MNHFDIIMLVTFLVVITIISLCGYHSYRKNEDDIDKLLRKERHK